MPNNEWISGLKVKRSCSECILCIAAHKITRQSFALLMSVSPKLRRKAANIYSNACARLHMTTVKVTWPKPGVTQAYSIGVGGEDSGDDGPWRRIFRYANRVGGAGHDRCVVIDVKHRYQHAGHIHAVRRPVDLIGLYRTVDTQWCRKWPLTFMGHLICSNREALLREEWQSHSHNCRVCVCETDRVINTKYMCK